MKQRFPVATSILVDGLSRVFSLVKDADIFSVFAFFVCFLGVDFADFFYL